MLPVFINLLRRLYFMRASRESAAYHSLPKEGIFMDQSRAPIMEALENFKDMRIVPFDVPGHKRGRGSPELTKFLGQQCMTVDVNSMKPLDNLCHPTSVIREAEELASRMQFQHAEASAMPVAEAEEAAEGDLAVATPVRSEPKIGRNEPCPCGSGKKYKHCHGQVG
mgnify:CR=1 FL=1